MGKRGRPPHPDILTPREWQVLDLLRQGLTNEQIAQRLDISPATAKYHVSEIISKLGVQTREEAAAWQPEAVAVRWWRRAFAPLAANCARVGPLTIAKIAVVAASAAALAGLGVLAWGTLGTSEERTGEVAAATTSGASTSTATVSAVAATVSPQPSVPPSPPSTLGQGFSFGPSIVVSDIGNGSELVLAEVGSDPRWSPDGTWIAYLSGNFGGLGSSTTVHIVRPDGTGARSFSGTITTGDVIPYQCMNQLYAWGPGSDQIFLCSGGGLFSVAVNGDTTPQHLVDAFSFSVAPDGVHIAYATWPAQAPTAVIRIRDLLTNEDQYLIDGGWPAWSPDGKFVAYLTDQGVNAVEIESGRVAVIDADSAAARNLYAPLSWSPDSSAIAYSKGGVIYLKDVASKEAVHAVAEGYSPVLSSDGLGLTYHVGFSCEDVYIAPVDRSAPPMRIGDGYHSAWSPDGSKIVSARPSYYTNCEPITR